MHSKQLKNMLVLARAGLRDMSQEGEGATMAEVWMDWKACADYAAALAQAETEAVKAEAAKKGKTDGGDSGTTAEAK